MNTLSRDAVVDHLASTLAERRRTAISRRGAYEALARAILMDDLQDRFTTTDLERQLTAIGEPAQAA
jgi:hypothetical protein